MLYVQVTLLNPDMCNPDFRRNRQIGRSRSLPIHIIPIRIVRILPNLDRNLGSTPFQIEQSCLYYYRPGLDNGSQCDMMQSAGLACIYSHVLLLRSVTVAWRSDTLLCNL